jgi:hypothetical protein
MSNILDTILIKDFITSPEIINSNYSTPGIDISFREAEFSIQLTWDSGIAPDMVISVEVSNDDVNYAKVTDSDQIVQGDVDGAVLFDIIGTGANYIRVNFEVISGSFTLQTCTYKGRRRH